MTAPDHRPAVDWPPLYFQAQLAAGGRAVLTIKRLIWALLPCPAFRKTERDTALVSLNGETRPLALPLAVTVNAGAILCLVFVSALSAFVAALTAFNAMLHDGTVTHSAPPLMVAVPTPRHVAPRGRLPSIPAE